MTVLDISDDDFARALEAGQADGNAEIRARTVRYLPEQDAIEIVTRQNAGFLVPRGWIDALRDVPAEALAGLAVWPDGSAIELDDHDVHISIPGLMAAILPRLLPTQVLAAIFASRGGKKISAAKSAAAKMNGRKGGRPRGTGKPAAA